MRINASATCRAHHPVTKSVLQYHNAGMRAAACSNRRRRERTDGRRRRMGIEGHRYLMTAPGAPLAREAFAAEPAAGEVVVAIAGCGVCHTDLGYYYDGVRTNHAAAARARARDLRPGRRRRSRRGALGGQGGHRARRAALRRVRSLPPGARPDLPRAEDARQRHPGRLRLAHRRAGTRPLRGRRGASRARRPDARRGLDRRRRAHHALPGGAPGGRRAGQPRHRRRRGRRGRLLRAGRAGVRREGGGDRRRPGQARPRSPRMAPT